MREKEGVEGVLSSKNSRVDAVHGGGAPGVVSASDGRDMTRARGRDSRPRGSAVLRELARPLKKMTLTGGTEAAATQRKEKSRVDVAHRGTFDLDLTA